MPELPEVETVKNALKKRLINRSITSCTIYWNNIISYPTAHEFKMKIIKQHINDIERRGKFILFILDDYILLSHLRMEGKYYFQDNINTLNKHDHVVFTLDNKELLVYNDTRKFGKMYLIEKDKINIIGPLKDLGKEPFDNTLDTKYLHSKYNKKNIPIKSVLLDQSIITGIGNIYADEILYLSKINPKTPASKLKNSNLEDIITYTKEVLTKAISLGGTTIHTYTSVDGITGKFQNNLLVHGKKICPTCNSPILKIKISGRGTYYCPKCQK